MSLRVFVVPLVLLALLVVPANAQDDFDDLSRARRNTPRRNTPPIGGPNASGTSASTAVSAGSDLLEDGKKLTGTVAGAGIDFKMGRDNLGFANMHGAISMGGMAGNCYTMAVVSKIFFERATFKPEVKTPEGFTFDGLAGAIAQATRFQVNAYPSLCEMSNEPSFGEREVFEHLAREKGIEPGGPLPAFTGKKLQMARLMQVVSTIHYLHYMQYQGGKFLEAVLRLKLRGSEQVQQVTRREMDAFAGQLASGKTCLTLLLGTAEVYGHVVLTTRMTRTADADYLEIYDSNVQYGAEIRPSVMKVLKNGMVAGYYRKEADGRLSPHGIYDGDSWWEDKKTLAIMLLGDDSLGERDGKDLAKKIASSDVETSYLLAAGEFVKGVTERSPQQETLRTAVLNFVRKVQSVQASLGRDVSEQLTATSDVHAINRVLAARSDLAVRSQFPYALPPGITLTNTRVQLDPNVEDRATLATTITLEKDSPVHGLSWVLEKSTSLAQYGQLADWVKTVRERVGPTRVSAQVELSLLKSEMPAGFKTRYGVMPYVQKSHLVIGDLTSGPRLPSDHMIEISEKALQGVLEVLLTKLGVIDYVWNFEYVLIPEKRVTYWQGRSFVLTHEQRRQGTVRFSKMAVDCLAPTLDAPAGSLALNVDVSAFVEVNPVRDGKGVNASARPLGGRATMERPGSAKPGHWTVRSAINASLTVDDGTHNLVSFALLQLADKAFPFFANRVNQLIREKLSAYAVLVKPFGISYLDCNTRSLTVLLSEGVVDLRLLAKQLFNVEVPATLESAGARDDRVVLGASYR